MKNQPNVHDLLDQLGETPEQVAETLKKKSIKGHRMAGDCCPVANYLREVGVVEPCITAEEVWWRGPDGKLQAADTDDPVSEFIGNFDAGAYPHLEEKHQEG